MSPPGGYPTAPAAPGYPSNGNGNGNGNGSRPQSRSPMATGPTEPPPFGQGDHAPPPGNVGVAMTGLADQQHGYNSGEPARTQLGVARAPGTPWYGGGPAPQGPEQGVGGMPSPYMQPGNQSGQMRSPGGPGQMPGPQGYGHPDDAGDPNGYPNGYPGGAMGSSPYGSQPEAQQGYAQNTYNQSYGMAPAPAVESPPMEGTRTAKKVSIGRDIAIGVAIAAIVLGGFLAVKFLVLDRGKGSAHAPPTSSIATVTIELTNGGTAQLFVDNERMAVVSDKQDIRLTPGKRSVRLVGPTGAKCEKDVELVAGKTTTMQCALAVAPAVKAPTVPTVPTIPTAGSGSAAVTTTMTPAPLASGSGSGSGSGSAAAAVIEKPVTTTTKPVDPKAVTTTTKPVDPKAVTTTTKPVDPKAVTTTKPVTITKPVDTKPTTVIATTKPTTTKPVDTKPTTTKPVDKKPIDKKPVDKLPTELGPADRAAAMGSKGYLQVYSKPSAKVAVDGADTGMSTPVTGQRLSLSPGKHKVTLTVATGDKHSFPVTIEAGKTATVSKDLQ